MKAYSRYSDVDNLGRVRLGYSGIMCFHLEQPERSEIFIFSGLSLSRQSNSEKIAADNLIVFAGVFFTEEIEDTESL